MDKEIVKKLEELVLYINLDLNILYNALKYFDDELDIAAISHSVEKIYNNAKKAQVLF